MAEETRYCNYCDQDTAEWHDDDYDDVELCPACFSILWASREAYIEEMKEWLPERSDIARDDVEDFLRHHGNPGKGQATAILR